MFYSNNKIIIKKHFLKEYLAEILFTRIYLGEQFKCAIFVKRRMKKLFLNIYNQLIGDAFDY